MGAVYGGRSVSYASLSGFSVFNIVSDGRAAYDNCIKQRECVYWK